MGNPVAEKRTHDIDAETGGSFSKFRAAFNRYGAAYLSGSLLRISKVNLIVTLACASFGACVSALVRLVAFVFEIEYGLLLRAIVAMSWVPLCVAVCILDLPWLIYCVQQIVVRMCHGLRAQHKSTSGKPPADKRR